MDKNKTPDELAKAVADALSAMAQSIHMESGAPIVVLRVQHTSDAMAGQGNTQFQCHVLGAGMLGAPASGAPEARAPGDIAEEELRRALEKRKDSGGK
jgi:hypothetical protein